MTRVVALAVGCCLLFGCGGEPFAGVQPEAQKSSGDATTQTPQAPASSKPDAVVTEGGSRFFVEVVADPATRAQGLMYRSSLSPDRGMLFVFAEKAAHGFWMKNTLIPLDIIWLDETFEIVHIEHDVQPCRADPCPSYPPGMDAVFVLELGAGQARENDIQTGDFVEFEGGIENIVPQ